MSHLSIGAQAPDFKALDQNEKEVSLSTFLGKKVILYFYPKDDTPGCTAEACNFRDNYAALISSGYEVIGVSADTEISHKKFETKYALPFTLVADTSKSIAELYGVWVEKNNYGKKYMGISRETFVIDEKGVILHILKKIDTKNAAEQVLKAVGKTDEGEGDHT